MTRKAMVRRQRRTVRRSSRPAARATTRIGRKSHRTSKAVAGTKLGRQTAAARRDAIAPEHEHRIHVGAVDQAHGAHAEEDEDLDWLGEEEDPRSQIVEDDDEDRHHHKEEW